MHEEIVAAARYFRESNRLLGIEETVVEKMLSLAILDGLTNLKYFSFDESDMEQVHLMKHADKPNKNKKSKKTKKPTTKFSKVYKKEEDYLLYRNELSNS